MPNLPPMPPKPPTFNGPPPAFWPPQSAPGASGGSSKCSATVRRYVRKNRAALMKKWQKQIQAWMAQAKAAQKAQKAQKTQKTKKNSD